MASPATINLWLEDLASSILSTKRPTVKGQNRKHIDSFRRRVRHHTFVRTNQFDVETRLTGLEEKFQILNRNDLSDKFFRNRAELEEHEQRWLPDVLDLLLRLSKDPTNAFSVSGLYDSHEVSISPHSQWTDTTSDDPFDQNDEIWRQPEFSDLSSDDDDAEYLARSTSTAHSGQASNNHDAVLGVDSLEPFDLSIQDDTDALLKPSSQSLGKEVTEIQLIRESLFMLQDLPTTLFTFKKGHVEPRAQLRLQGVSVAVIRDLLARLISIREKTKIVRNWLQLESSIVYMQIMKAGFLDIVVAYLSWINTHIERLLHPNLTVAASILQTVCEAEENAKALLSASDVVRTFEIADPVGCLDMLYDAVRQRCLFGAEVAAHEVLQIFVKALHACFSPLWMWLQDGKLENNSSPFFVQRKSTKVNANNLWQDWYKLIASGPDRPPAFLTSFTEVIFACGKTSAFLRLVVQDSTSTSVDPVAAELDRFTNQLSSASGDPTIPFPAAFNALLDDCFATMLGSRTTALKEVLDSQCGLGRTIKAFGILYFGQDGVITDNIDSKLFSRIDNCINTWNDRFLLVDMLEENFSALEFIDAEAIIVHSVHTSSRSMESRRRSVKILAALAIEYRLPWPVANMIPSESMASYRRIALHLTQIRRAKYCLERIAYILLRQQPISENARDQQYAQLILFMFLQFTNTLYDHFTTSIIKPLTAKMCEDLKAAPTIDQMIAAHAAYITKLELACLTAKQVKLLRDTLLELLDMCIHFADLVQPPSNSQRKGSDDFEASSFISAQSQRKRRRRRRRSAQDDDEDDSEADEDDHEEGDDGGEGYSTFIVLDEGTSVIEEIRKLASRLRRQLDFFIAGLRGVGKSGDMIEQFEVLAGRLEWKKTS